MRPTVHALDVLPRDWRRFIAPNGSCGVGVDLATTTKEKSNPTAIALIQQQERDFVVRLVVRFKTQDPDVLGVVLSELAMLPHGLRLRRVCVDATNERFFSTALKQKMMGTCVVELVVGSEGIEFRQEKMNMKTYLGSLLINTLEDGHLLLPREEWLRNDLRLVKRDRGGFVADLDAEGNHGDTFDAIKLALHALARPNGGPVAAAGAPVTQWAQGGGDRPGIRNPFARAVSAVHRLFT